MTPLTQTIKQNNGWQYPSDTPYKNTLSLQISTMPTFINTNKNYNNGY